MRILCTALPLGGHINAVLPTARAARDAGHDVFFCCAPEFRPAVEEQGLVWIGGGVDDIGPLLVDPPRGSAEKDAFAQRVFAGAAAEAMVPDAIRAIDACSPDIVLRDSSEYGGYLAAERASLPHVSVATASWSALDNRRALVRDTLGALRARLGLPPDPQGARLTAYAHQCHMSVRFHGPGAAFPETARFFRHVSHARPGAAIPDWKWEDPSLPLVYASLGTNRFQNKDVLRAIVLGLGGERVNLVCSIRRDRSVSDFGPQPSNVRLEHEVPQPRLLERCRLFVNHGGFNGVKEALSVGVPMVLAPFSAEQAYATACCARLGVGLAVAREERDAVGFARAARIVLETPSFTWNARKIAAENAQLPGPEVAIASIEAIADAADGRRRKRATAFG